MKNKKILIGIIAAAAVIIAAVLLLNRRSSIFEIENKEDGSIHVLAQRADSKAGGIGYITIAEGQELYVRSNLTDNSSIKIEVFPGEAGAEADPLIEEVFTAVDARYFELPAGDYTVRISVQNRAEGSMTITSE